MKFLGQASVQSCWSWSWGDG